MRQLIITIIAVCSSFILNAQNKTWVCAAHAKDYSWMVFVYGEIAEPETKYGYWKFWVKCEYANREAQVRFDTDATYTKSYWEVNQDFTEYRFLHHIEYDENDKIIFQSNTPTRRYPVVPESLGMSVVETVKSIIENHNNGQ